MPKLTKKKKLDTQVEAETLQEDNIQQSIAVQFGKLYTEHRDEIIGVRRANDNKIVMNLEVVVEVASNLESEVKLALKFEEKKKYAFKSEEKFDSPEQMQMEV